MYVFFTDTPSDNLYIACFASLPDQVPQSGRNFASQDFITIFGRPDNMVLDIVDSMTLKWTPLSRHGFEKFKVGFDALSPS